MTPIPGPRVCFVQWNNPILARDEFFSTLALFNSGSLQDEDICRHVFHPETNFPGERQSPEEKLHPPYHCRQRKLCCLYTFFHRVSVSVEQDVKARNEQWRHCIHCLIPHLPMLHNTLNSCSWSGCIIVCRKKTHLQRCRAIQWMWSGKIHSHTNPYIFPCPSKSSRSAET